MPFPRIGRRWVRLFLLLSATFLFLFTFNVFHLGDDLERLKKSAVVRNSPVDKTFFEDGDFVVITFNGNYEPDPEKYALTESRRRGAGEQGRGVNVRGSDETKVQDAMKRWFMNVIASNAISLERGLHDQRSSGCRNLKYDAKLPNASVVIVFTDEAWTPLLRTVHSILNRTPKHLLHEIVLVDDFSQMDDMHEKLENYLAQFGHYVKLVRSRKRLGLIKARSTGAVYSNGEVVIFIDAHCEATKGWIEPLLQRVKDNPLAFVCPVIDSISDHNMAYNGGSAGGKGFAARRRFSFAGIGTFWWSLHYKMDPIPEREKKRRKNPEIDYLNSPTMAGGLFAVNRETFFKFGAYDNDMDIWGGENLEISFRAWMCGGSVEIIPCSHVGHIYRNGHPYNMTGRGGNLDVHGTNSKRMAEVWMDDYKRLYYVHRMDMKWYLDNVIPEKFIPDEGVNEYGLLRNPSTGLCLDTLQRLENKDTILIGVFHCQTGGSSSQMFSLTNDGILRRETVCADVADSFRFIGESNHLQMADCTIHSNGKVWEFKQGHLRLTTIDKCLDVQGLKAGDDVLFASCDKSSNTQQWEFVQPR